MRISIVIPTYQRRDLVVANVLALANQDFAGEFEVIVVVDGAKDGTAPALRGLDVPFPLTVIEQKNQGAAAARNHGAGAARGEILLFIDDDMEAHPRLLAVHDQTHRDGADVVLGDLPLHPGAPKNFISAAVGKWADGRGKRLAAPGAVFHIDDLLTGQISIARSLFENVGGFDLQFTAEGTFGDEDLDFGHCLVRRGARVVFKPEAITWQNYIVTPAQHLRQWRQAGSADVTFARKHPAKAQSLFASNGAEHWPHRHLICRIFLTVPTLTAPFSAALRWLAIVLANLLPTSPRIGRLFFFVRSLEYWRGVCEAGGMPVPRMLRVLAYHAIGERGESPALQPYGVSAPAFRRQLQMLHWAGCNFISGEELLTYLEGKGGLPSRPVLLTFDDCFEDLLTVALPILKEFRIPVVAFAVSARVGQTDQWDEIHGGPRRRLLDATGLRELTKWRVEIGAHGRTHRELKGVPDEDLDTEISGSVAELESMGLPRPRMFCYPYGEYDQRTLAALERANIRASFTVRAGGVYPDQDPRQIPRLEILAQDTGWRFLWKVFRAGRSLSLNRLLLKRLSLTFGLVPHIKAAVHSSGMRVKRFTFRAVRWASKAIARRA